MTVFRIASPSKRFAAVLTGLLVDDGLIGWDDKVKKYLPNLELADSVSTFESIFAVIVVFNYNGIMPIRPGQQNKTTIQRQHVPQGRLSSSPNGNPTLKNFVNLLGACKNTEGLDLKVA